MKNKEKEVLELIKQGFTEEQEELYQDIISVYGGNIKDEINIAFEITSDYCQYEVYEDLDTKEDVGRAYVENTAPDLDSFILGCVDYEDVCDEHITVGGAFREQGFVFYFDEKPNQIYDGTNLDYLLIKFETKPQEMHKSALFETNYLKDLNICLEDELSEVQLNCYNFITELRRSSPIDKANVAIAILEEEYLIIEDFYSDEDMARKYLEKLSPREYEMLVECTDLEKLATELEKINPQFMKNNFEVNFGDDPSFICNGVNAKELLEKYSEQEQTMHMG